MQLLMWFSPTSCHFVPFLGPNILFSTCCQTPYIKDQHSYIFRNSQLQRTELYLHAACDLQIDEDK
jgi:hypothetical protein